jgi:MFS family permease
MRRLQIQTILICIVLCIIDGYEVLVMALVAPTLAKVWSLGAVEVGYLLSAGIFGMAVGAIVISPLADVIGRRRHIIICMSLTVIGMALSAAAENVPQLLAFRGIAAFYAISPFVYPTVHRGAGVGLMIGVGRGVAILAPI